MYAVVDIETNGGDFCQEKIIEIAVYRFDGHKIVDQLISIVNPEAEISKYVQKLTGITPKKVKTAPKFHEIAKRLIEITDGATLVGHNISYDYRVIRQSFAQLGYEFEKKTIDTLPLTKKLIPNEESYSLGKLVKSLGIPLTQHHRAGGDARATLDLFRLLLTKDNDGEILTIHQEEKQSRNYVNKMNRLIKNLPHCQGIVYLQNAKGKILHSSYSENIHWFVARFFNSDSKKLKRKQEEVEQVQYELVGSDLLAYLILASRSIKYRKTFSYGLYFQDDKWCINNKHHKVPPIMKFKSFSQANKVLELIKNNTNIYSLEILKNMFSIPSNALLLIKGRQLGEKAFIMIENRQIVGYGFYELYTQIKSQDLINRIKIPVKLPFQYIENELKLEILKGEVEILPLSK